MKRYIFAAIALTMLGGSPVNADTSLLPAADGWTKITTVPTAQEISMNYYVFVDDTRDLMLGVAKGVHQATKWYSLGLYYQTSVEPTSASINGKAWILETQGDGFALRNLEYSALCFQTESAGAWMFDTNDVASPNSWSQINLAYADGTWTLQNGKNGGSNYIGPWDSENFANGAECAANKSGNDIGKFHIYAISRTQFKQNLLDNASASNPVDVTPWYVTNATFDLGNRTGWTEEGSDGNNNTSYGGGCEIWHRLGFNIHQDASVLNGKYKVSLQMAGTTGAGKVYATSNGTTKEAASSAAAGSDYQNTILAMIQDRTFGQVTTDEITVSDGSLQIGMKCETTDQWLVFDNFKLYCTGLDLSAYQEQMTDLVKECNDFISSAVVPDACETVIADAITTYNQTYSTAKDYSTAIVALTAVLDTYRNDTELKSAYAAYYAFKAKVEALVAGQASSSALTTFNTAVSDATTAVEAATTVAAIETQTANLRSATLTYISSVEGQFNITFLASQNYADWKKKDGSAAGIVADQYLANRPNTIPSFAENFEWTAATTGNVLYQTVSDLPAGYYQVGMYTMALSTSQRDNITTEATEGDANRSFAFAGDLTDASSIQRTGMPIKFATAVNFDDLTTLDVNIHLTGNGLGNNLTFGVQKDANGSNWHFAQIINIIYSSTPDLTGLQATRDALVAEATGLLASNDAALLTPAQNQALQEGIDAGNAANTFETLNTATLTTLPNAINTAKQQIQQAKANRELMIAALERFENDYNLADGTDYRRITMSADAWATLITKVNAVTTALDDVSQASNYGTLCDALIDQMDATDNSLLLFKRYKAMSDGTRTVVSGIADDASETDTDATETAAISALNTAFVNHALAQDNTIDMGAYLGENLDFSAAEGVAVNTDNNNNIHAVTGWEVNVTNADTWAVLQTHQSDNDEKLYMRKNWGSSPTSFLVRKQKMLPVGKYTLSLSWNSNMANMTNRSSFTVGESNRPIGEATDGAKTLTYDFEVTESAQPFVILLGFQKTGTDNTPAQLIVDDVVLTYTQPAVTLADSGTDAADNATTITDKNGYLCNVTFNGRTLYKDGSWNTLCLPFNMTAEQVTAQLAPAALMELDTENTVEGHKTGIDGTTLYLNFKNATSITAGRPYIVKWASGSDIVNPVFRAVTVTSGSAGSVTSADNALTFQGTYVPAPLTKGDPKNLYLSTDNKLNYPKSDGFKVNAFRAYFLLSSNNAREFVINFGDEATSINAIKEMKDEWSGAIYNLNGQRVSKAQKGVYITNGKKIIKK